MCNVQCHLTLLSPRAHRRETTGSGDVSRACMQMQTQLQMQSTAILDCPAGLLNNLLLAAPT
jgi:hypothetical protein